MKKFFRIQKSVKISWYSEIWNTKSWDTFAFLGRFPTHTSPTPPLTPQTILDSCIQNLFGFQLCIGWGEGRTARHFRKGCTVLRGNREMNIAVLSNRNVYYIPYPLLLQPVAANFTASSRSSSCLIESGKPRRMISYTKLHNTNFNSDFCYIHFIVISQFSHLHSGLSQNRSLARA